MVSFIYIEIMKHRQEALIYAIDKIHSQACCIQLIHYKWASLNTILIKEVLLGREYRYGCSKQYPLGASNTIQMVVKKFLG